MQRSTAMRSLIALSLLVPTLASAQPAADSLVDLAVATHVLAKRGDCAGARRFSSEIRRRDPDFHAVVITTDLVITKCKPAKRTMAVLPARASAPVPQDGGPRLAGQLLLGATMTLTLGLVGGGVAAAADEDASSVFVGLGLGLTAGASIGVIVMGDNAASDYSGVATFVGAAVGSAVGLIALDAMHEQPGSAFALAVVLPTLGAMAGFNLTRRVVEPPPPPLAPPAPTISNDTAVVPLVAGAF